MASSPEALSGLLQATLDPTESKKAEAAIRQEEESLKPGFSLNLLQVVASDALPPTTRLAGALFFKNFVRRKWVDIDGRHRLPGDEAATIKRELVGLMITSPPAIQAQLGDTISLIAESDFWQGWDTLVDDLVNRLTPDDAQVNNGVLRVAHSIFKKWRPLYRTDDLFTEINHVLSRFAKPFLTLLQNVDRTISENQGNQDVLQSAFSTLNLIFKLAYDLTCQDLPPDFEDNLGAIATVLQKYLQYDNPLLHTDDDTEAGPLEFVKAEIFELMILWRIKYTEVFEEHLAQFVEPSWTLLSTIGLDIKFDVLVSKALQFLTQIVSISRFAEVFADEGTLNQVVEKVIIPNLTLRESDLELFEDEPIEFIRRDLEGADNDTRRRAATGFLRVLLEKLEEQVTNVGSLFMNKFLEDYNQDPANNWKSKDTAIYLFSSIAAKGTVTSARGVQTSNPRINIPEFFNTHIAGDLSSNGSHVIIQVDALKFIYMFRSHLAASYWKDAFPSVVQRLASSDYVVYNYAAVVVERVLLLTDEQNKPVISKAEVLNLAPQLVQHLFTMIQSDSRPEKTQENEFLMKCVMRVLFVVKDGAVAIADEVLTKLVEIINTVVQNPSNPRFCYYLFESLGALIKYAAPSDPHKFEQALFGPLAGILTSEITEFEPYVFQLFAALLDCNPSQPLSEYYIHFIQGVLQTSLWENKGNVPALIRLLCSVITRGGELIVQHEFLVKMLGIFQKMVASKAHESHAFRLMGVLVNSIPKAALDDWFKDILSLMLTRLSSSKTEVFALGFVKFYHHISALDQKGYGTDFFIQKADTVQNDVFRPIYTQIILPDTQKLATHYDRKVAVISLTKNLADSEAFVTRYSKGWNLTCQALLKLLVNPPLPHARDQILAERDLDDIGFAGSFTELTSCAEKPHDPFADVTNVKSWVGQYLNEANGRHNGKIATYVQERLSEETRQALVAIMQQ